MCPHPLRPSGAWEYPTVYLPNYMRGVSNSDAALQAHYFASSQSSASMTTHTPPSSSIATRDIKSYRATPNLSITDAESRSLSCSPRNRNLPSLLHQHTPHRQPTEDYLSMSNFGYEALMRVDNNVVKSRLEYSQPAELLRTTPAKRSDIDNWEMRVSIDIGDEEEEKRELLSRWADEIGLPSPPVSDDGLIAELKFTQSCGENVRYRGSRGHDEMDQILDDKFQNMDLLQREVSSLLGKRKADGSLRGKEGNKRRSAGWIIGC